MKLILGLLLFTGCSDLYVPTHDSIDENYSMPEGMKDCKIFELNAKQGPDLYIVNCPNATTTTNYSYRSGKITHFQNITLINK